MALRQQLAQVQQQLQAIRDPAPPRHDPTPGASRSFLS